MLRHFIIVIFMVTVLNSAIVFAGVTYFEIRGNTVIRIRQNNIRLEREVMRVDDEVVKAVFTFENTTQKEIDFKMGFAFAGVTESH